MDTVMLFVTFGAAVWWPLAFDIKIYFHENLVFTVAVFSSLAFFTC